MNSVICLRLSPQVVGIRWPEKIANKELWQRTRQLPPDTEDRKRKWSWIGHTLKKEETNITRQSQRWNLTNPTPEPVKPYAETGQTLHWNPTNPALEPVKPYAGTSQTLRWNRSNPTLEPVWKEKTWTIKKQLARLVGRQK